MKEIKNFFNFLIHLTEYWAYRKDTKCSKELWGKRLNICKICEHLVNKKFLGIINKPRCGICGCFIFYKTQIIFEECPNEPKKW